MKVKPMECYKSITEHKKLRPRGQRIREKGEDKKEHIVSKAQNGIKQLRSLLQNQKLSYSFALTSKFNEKLIF